ncbi:MAG: hypothetical protein Q4P36_03185 [Bowdeniella nasicola]|nr:hypothetical protein [Bowdeniella nasicola]
MAKTSPPCPFCRVGLTTPLQPSPETCLLGKPPHPNLPLSRVVGLEHIDCCDGNARIAVLDLSPVGAWGTEPVRIMVAHRLDHERVPYRSANVTIEAEDLARAGFRLEPRETHADGRIVYDVVRLNASH